MFNNVRKAKSPPPLKNLSTYACETHFNYIFCVAFFFKIKNSFIVPILYGKKNYLPVELKKKAKTFVYYF